MNNFGSAPSTNSPPAEPDFSFVYGGLLYRFLQWAHLADPAMLKVRRAIVAISLLAWLPLLALSALDGKMLGAGVSAPFLLDLEVHVRFLVALPLLILAEVEVHKRLPPMLRQFLARRLVPQQSVGRLEAAVASAFRMRNSVVAELLMIALVYGVGILIVWRQYLALDMDTWYATGSAPGSKLTFAGIWYGFVSVPIVQFLLLRWYWRLLSWARLLWQVSRIELSLVPGHPDRVGGLGFLASTALAFNMLAAAHGALLAGQIASRIFFAGAKLPEFEDLIGGVVVFMLCAVLGPLLVFAPQLMAAKRAGLVEFGVLAERYVREFARKWMGRATYDESLVGSPDIQSLADLGNSYEVTRTMRIAPITSQAIIGLAAATLAPIAPLLLTMIPFGELIKKLFSIAF